MLLLSIKWRRYLGAHCSSGFPIWRHEGATPSRKKGLHLSPSLGVGAETRAREGGRAAAAAFCLQARTRELGAPRKSAMSGSLRPEPTAEEGEEE